MQLKKICHAFAAALLAFAAGSSALSLPERILERSSQQRAVGAFEPAVLPRQLAAAEPSSPPAEEAAGGSTTSQPPAEEAATGGTTLLVVFEETAKTMQEAELKQLLLGAAPGAKSVNILRMINQGIVYDVPAEALEESETRLLALEAVKFVERDQIVHTM